jgi:hypothetical protein
MVLRGLGKDGSWRASTADLGLHAAVQVVCAQAQHAPGLTGAFNVGKTLVVSQFQIYGSTDRPVLVTVKFKLRHYPLAPMFDYVSLVCYNYSMLCQLPSRASFRETVKDRNADAKAACGFFMVLRSCVAAFSSTPQVRRIMPWPAVR